MCVRLKKHRILINSVVKKNLNSYIGVSQLAVPQELDRWLERASNKSYKASAKCRES